jgi:protein SCO1/2
VMVAASLWLGVWQQNGSSSSDRSPNDASATFRPAFSLTDHRGYAVTERSYDGKWLLVFFGFTNCPDICPTTLAELAHVMEQLGEDAGAVKPLFISIDPERDKIGPMADYVSAFHPDIVGLTGTVSQVAEAVESFRAYYEKQPQESAPNGYTMAHSSALYLISPEGAFVRAYGYGTSPEKITEDLKKRL